MPILAGDQIPATTQVEAFNRLFNLDLSMVRLKLASSEGEAWTEAELDLYEREYRRFIVLNLMYPLTSIVPCHAVDMFWHAHILDTAAYRIDCEAVFGHFFEHFPYFGLRDELDAANLVVAYDETLALYRDQFGQLPAGVWQNDDASNCQRKGCKPMKCRGI